MHSLRDLHVASLLLLLLAASEAGDASFAHVGAVVGVNHPSCLADPSPTLCRKALPGTVTGTAESGCIPAESFGQDRDIGLVLSERPKSSGSGSENIHLVSLPPLTDSLPPPVRSLWRWKDAALGDGRDYFVPRPRALRALNKLLVGTNATVFPHVENAADRGEQGRTEKRSRGDELGGKHVRVDESRVTVEECGVLSNCARLDIVVYASSSANSSSESPEHVSAAVRMAVAKVLASQLTSYQSKRRAGGGGPNAALEGLAAFLDLPGIVDEGAPPVHHDVELLETIASNLAHTVGVTDVTRHMCLVAAGMAPRPSRPGRPVPFRPFSSRDAHVMLQLKRSAEVIPGSRVKAMFDAALSAGKAARDANEVPDIVCLRGYGSGSSKYSVEPPKELMARAEEAALELAIEPAVRRCRDKLRARDAASLVSNLREKVTTTLIDEGFDLENNSDYRRLLHSGLHAPCIKLREGKSVDEATILNDIRQDLMIQKKKRSLR